MASAIKPELSFNRSSNYINIQFTPDDERHYFRFELLPIHLNFIADQYPQSTLKVASCTQVFNALKRISIEINRTVHMDALSKQGDAYIDNVRTKMSKLFTESGIPTVMEIINKKLLTQYHPRATNNIMFIDSRNSYRTQFNPGRVCILSIEDHVYENLRDPSKANRYINLNLTYDEIAKLDREKLINYGMHDSEYEKMDVKKSGKVQYPPPLFLVKFHPQKRDYKDKNHLIMHIINLILI